MGIAIISVLSGFGVVNTPFNTWSSRKRKVSERDYVVAENAYNQTIKMIEEKKKTLETMHRQQELTESKNSKSTNGIFGKVSSLFSGSAVSGKWKMRYDWSVLLLTFYVTYFHNRDSSVTNGNRPIRRISWKYEV